MSIVNIHVKAINKIVKTFGRNLIKDLGKTLN